MILVYGMGEGSREAGKLGTKKKQDNLVRARAMAMATAMGKQRNRE